MRLGLRNARQPSAFGVIAEASPHLEAPERFNHELAELTRRVRA
jgi:hypothetical protein